MTINLGQYAKFFTALAGQGLVYAQYEYGSGNKWVTLATAAAAALGVYAVPNTPKAPAPPPALAGLTASTLTQPPLSDAEVAELKQELAERLPAPGQGA